MDTNEIIEHVADLGLPDAGIEYTRRALESPSRIVGRSRFLAVATRFASQKLGQVIQSESHTCELPFLHAQELDDDVVACMDQPPPLYVESIDKRGHRHRGCKTPDYLVIRKGGVFLYECKTPGELARLVSEQPGNWGLDGGRFRYLPAEAPAASLGMSFLIHDASTIGPIHAANLNILVDVKRAGLPPLDERTLVKATRLLLMHNGLTISNLATELHFDSVTPILAAALHKQVFVAIRLQLLGKPDSTTIYATEAYLELAERALLAGADVDCLREENYQAPIALSKKAFSKAIAYFERVKKIRTGELSPTRSDYRHMAALRRCKESGQLPLLEIAPAYHRRGSKKSLPDAIEKVIADEIRANYSRPERWSISALYRSISAQLKQKGLTPISYETLRQRVRKNSRTSLAKAREGYRAANAVMPPTHMKDRAIRACFAWEKAHVDATVLDEKIWLATPLSDILARPTIYLLIDEATSYILAYWVCFGSAGDQAVACLFRDCIRRHQTFPSETMHDQGSEFFSIYVESFTASIGADLLRRPSAAPRWGSHVESAFHRINELIIHRMPGNTQNDQRGRSSTADKRSAAHARYNLMTFMSILEETLIDWLNNRPIKDEIATPDEKFLASQQQFKGITRKITLSSELLANTAIPAEGKRRVDHARGIRFENRRYVGPGIRCPSLHGMKVSIRWEPYNPNIIYADVRGSWVRLTCSGYQELENAGHLSQMTELHLRLGTASAARLAREEADHQLATQQVNLLTEQPVPVVKKCRPNQDPPEPDLFEQARKLCLDEGDL